METYRDNVGPSMELMLITEFQGPIPQSTIQRDREQWVLSSHLYKHKHTVCSNAFTWTHKQIQITNTQEC